MKHTLNLSYGETQGQKIDVFPAKNPNSPVFIFIHGGYFRALDKSQYSYMAKPLVNAGYTVVLINYDLAPSVPVSTIVEQNLKAFDWVYNNVSSFNGDKNKLVLCGHSVGAFLVAKILEKDWTPEIKQSVAGAILLSGIYDLSKIKLSYLNKDLHLTDEDVTHLSPIFAQATRFPPTLVAVGDDETQEFIEQSERYAEKLKQADSPCDYSLLQNKNHYTVSRMLSNNNNILMDTIKKMVKANIR